MPVTHNSSQPTSSCQGHPHATLAYLLVEAADVTELQNQLQIQIQQGSGSIPQSRPWELLQPLVQRYWLGQAGGRAKEAAARLLEQQRDNVVLVASLGAVQAMMGKTTVRGGRKSPGRRALR